MGQRDLMEAIDAFMQAMMANDTLRARELLVDHPDLLDTQTEAVLHRVIAFAQSHPDARGWAGPAEQCLGLLKRCRETGVTRAFLELGDLSVLPECRSAMERAQQAEQRFFTGGDAAAIEEAAAAWSEILAHPAMTSVPQRIRAAIVNNAATVLLRGYLAGGHLHYLQAAIQALEQVETSLPHNSPQLPTILSNLGYALTVRYERFGSGTDAQRAIDHFDTSLRLTLDGDPDRVGFFSGLGSILRTRYERMEDPSDLARAVAAHEHAEAALADHSDEDRISCLNGLGNVLLVRNAVASSRWDVEKALDCYRQILVFAGDSHLRPGLLTGYGNALWARYGLTGAPEDLDRAIKAFDEALNLTPLMSPELPPRLDNLGVALHDRYKLHSQASDLIRAAELLQQTVDLTPEDAPQLPRYLDHLGLVLRDTAGLGGDGS